VKGIVIVPCWRRADFLWACLDRLLQAHGWEQYEYLISIDRDPSPEVVEVAHAYRSEFAGAPDGSPIQIITPGSHQFSGNSFNLLNAYRVASEKTNGLVVMVEEDVMVSRGFLRWTEAAHALVPDCFGVSACRDQNAPLPDALAQRADPRTGVGDPRSWVYERPTYQSLAVSFRAEVVRRFVQMVTPDYFADPVETLAKWFPVSRIPKPQAEQDGFIGRVLEDWVNGVDWTGMIYPVVPRASHYGFVGYNRSGGMPLYDGTPAERGRRILAMTDVELNQRADARFRDITPCDLDAVEAAPLVLRRPLV
jgi:hypothetical protein